MSMVEYRSQPCVGACGGRRYLQETKVAAEAQAEKGNQEKGKTVIPMGDCEKLVGLIDYRGRRY